MTSQFIIELPSTTWYSSSNTTLARIVPAVQGNPLEYHPLWRVIRARANTTRWNITLRSIKNKIKMYIFLTLEFTPLYKKTRRQVGVNSGLIKLGEEPGYEVDVTSCNCEGWNIELLHIECVLLYPVSQKSVATKWRIYKGKINFVIETMYATSKMADL